MKQYDAIVIGSGQAGVPLAKKLAMAGKKTALIEKRFVGGTCINDGCTPTKTMVASAKLAYLAKHSSNLGIHLADVAVDLSLIKMRKDGIVQSFRDGSQAAIERTENLDLLFGHASFTGPNSILIKLNEGGEMELSADLVFINTGTQTAIPGVAGLDTIDYLTSTSIMELHSVPKHLLIIGASYIGMEFGQMFRRFGSEVTMLEQSPRPLPREDEDVATEIVNLLQQEGIEILTEAQAVQINKLANGTIDAELMVGTEKRIINCSHILVAAGRSPQTKALNLQAAGIETNDRGFIKVNEKLETNVTGVYALGDVNGGPSFTHISYNDYVIVYRNLFEHTNLTTTNRLVPYCMFTDPQLACIGLNESQATKKGLKFKVAKMPMTYVARSIEKGDTRGFMKAIIDPDTKLILGACVIGEEGGEIMAMLQLAMMGNLTYEQLHYCVFAHPTYAEALNNLFLYIKP